MLDLLLPSAPALPADLPRHQSPTSPLTATAPATTHLPLSHGRAARACLLPPRASAHAHARVQGLDPHRPKLLTELLYPAVLVRPSCPRRPSRQSAAVLPPPSGTTSRTPLRPLPLLITGISSHQGPRHAALPPFPAQGQPCPSPWSSMPTAAFSLHHRTSSENLGALCGEAK